MLTPTDAKDYLDALGVTLPDAILEPLVNRANGVDACLAQHYDADTAQLIGLYLVGLMAAANGARMISSQSAPSGASQSFAYRTLPELWKSVSGLLRSLDTERCTTALIPPDPTQTLHAGLWIGKGCCMQGDR